MEMPFTRHCGTRIFPMSWGGSHWHHDFDDDEAWKVFKSMESGARSAEPGLERRKERFLSAGEAAWQETNTCKYSRFETSIVFVLRVFGANPLHCLYFSQNTKKTTRENSAHSKPLTKDSSIPFACHAKENLVFIRAVARLCQIPGLAFLQCI